MVTAHKVKRRSRRIGFTVMGEPAAKRLLAKTKDLP
jgi:hypothetical protein